MTAPGPEPPETTHRQPQYYPPAPRAHEPRRLKVLVAEADTPARIRLVRLLSGDCQVACAETVRQAMRVVRHAHFDLLICDLHLPASGGLALLYYIKLLAPETRVALVTDKADERITSQAILHGALDCFVRPLSDEIVRLLISLMRSGLEAKWELR
ncbi:MAG TPA: response regulator [Blastocatellia bacterium]|nr:response regulator [Blastocatellia bacterium]